PAEVLLQQSDASLESQRAEKIESDKFPLNEMSRLGWIPKVRGLAARADKYLADLLERAGGLDVAEAAFYRKNDNARANAKSDPYALKAWCWKVLATAHENRPKQAYKAGTVTLTF